MGNEVTYWELWNKIKDRKIQVIYERNKVVNKKDMETAKKEAGKELREMGLNENSSPEDIKKALEEEKKNELIERWLKNPEIFKIITESEFDKKIVREELTRKVIFLCANGRLVKNCQIASYNLLVNDEAGAGKDYVTSKVLEIIPKEVYFKKTRISPTAFTYWHNSMYEPDWNWDGKILYTEDISENVLNSEVFKVMCSSGSSATIVIKQRAFEIDIKGKPVVITTTANSIPNPELTRRFEILNLDESTDQTREIMIRHSLYAMDGENNEYNKEITEAMKYLERVCVKIPYAEKLFMLFPTHSVMMRTKFPRFLDLIKASAAFHQYQRGRDSEGFIIANEQDYMIAGECMKKLTSNNYMVSLTKNQKRILEKLEQSNEPLAATKIREQMNNFLSLPAIITNLSQLTGYGLLKVCLEVGAFNREVEKYTINPAIKQEMGLVFPKFETLINTKEELK